MLAKVDPGRKGRVRFTRKRKIRTTRVASNPGRGAGEKNVRGNEGKVTKTVKRRATFLIW